MSLLHVELDPARDTALRPRSCKAPEECPAPCSIKLLICTFAQNICEVASFSFAVQDFVTMRFVSLGSLDR